MNFVIDIWHTTGEPVLVVLALIAFSLAIYLAIVPHEIAHGLVAKWNGDLTAKVNGRLTMNPIVHFDPIGFLMHWRVVHLSFLMKLVQQERYLRIMLLLIKMQMIWIKN